MPAVDEPTGWRLYRMWIEAGVVTVLFVAAILGTVYLVKGSL